MHGTRIYTLRTGHENERTRSAKTKAICSFSWAEASWSVSLCVRAIRRNEVLFIFIQLFFSCYCLFSHFGFLSCTNCLRLAGDDSTNSSKKRREKKQYWNKFTKVRVEKSEFSNKSKTGNVKEMIAFANIHDVFGWSGLTLFRSTVNLRARFYYALCTLASSDYTIFAQTNVQKKRKENHAG